MQHVPAVECRPGRQGDDLVAALQECDHRRLLPLAVSGHPGAKGPLLPDDRRVFDEDAVGESLVGVDRLDTEPGRSKRLDVSRVLRIGASEVDADVPRGVDAWYERGGRRMSATVGGSTGGGYPAARTAAIRVGTTHRRRLACHTPC